MKKAHYWFCWVCVVIACGVTADMGFKELSAALGTIAFLGLFGSDAVVDE